MFLMANDSDGFNRWDAAQTLAAGCCSVWSVSTSAASR